MKRAPEANSKLYIGSRIRMKPLLVDERELWSASILQQGFLDVLSPKNVQSQVQVTFVIVAAAEVWIIIAAA